MRASKTPSVPALERGLAILERIAKSRRGLTFAQLTRHFDFPKSSVHTLLLTFEREGYLQRDDDDRPLHDRARSSSHIASMTLDGLVLREKAAPLLRALVADTGMTAHLADPRSRRSDASSRRSIARRDHRVATWVGKRMDVHCTSLGKCLIAHLPGRGGRSADRRPRPAPPQREHDRLAPAAEAGARADARPRLRH